MFKLLDSKIFTGVLLFFLSGCNREKSENRERLQELIFSQQVINQKYIYDSWGKPVSLETELIDKDGKLLHLRDLSKKHGTLFCRIPNLDCGPCISIELEDVLKRIKNIDVVFLVSCENKRHFKAFCELQKKAFLIEKRGLDIPIEQSNQVFFFLFDKKYALPKCYFIPIKEYPRFSEAYTKVVYANFLEK